MERSLKTVEEYVAPTVYPEESCAHCHYMRQLKQFGKHAPACTVFPPIPIGLPSPGGPQIVSVCPAVEMDYVCSLFKRSTDDLNG